MRKLALLVSLCLVCAGAFAYTWSYSADDVNNRVQDAIDALSGGSGQINADSATVTAVTATSATITTLEATSATLGAVTQAELNTLDSSLTNNLKAMSMIRVPLPTAMTQGINWVGEQVPSNFIIQSGFIKVTTTPTSTNSADAAMSLGVNYASDLAASAAITSATWGASAVGITELLPAIETGSGYIAVTSAAHRLYFTTTMAVTQMAAKIYLSGFQAQ